MSDGFPLTEFVLETVIRDGLGNLKANPSGLDDLLRRFKEVHFDTQYGQSRIDQVKTYLNDNQIKIVHAYNLQPSQMPCISIQMVNTEEYEGDQELGNFAPPALEDVDASDLATSLLMTAYDPLTGKLTFDNTADLSAVCTGARVYRMNMGNKEVLYDVTSPMSNTLNNKFVTIQKGLEATLDGLIGTVVSIDNGIICIGYAKGQVKLRETVRLGVHAKNDIHLTKFLYYILYYIIKTRQKSLITRGIHLDKGVVGIFDRLDQFNNENVYSRFFDLHCLTCFTYQMDEAEIASCFDVKLFVNDPDPDSEDVVQITPEES